MTICLIMFADFSLFDGAMEFLVGECDNDSSDEDDDGDFSTLPTSPLTSRLGVLRVAIETLPRVFCYERRHIQAAAVGMQHNCFHKLLPQRELESFSPASCYTGNFTLTMRGTHLIIVSSWMHTVRCQFLTAVFVFQRRDAFIIVMKCFSPVFT